MTLQRRDMLKGGVALAAVASFPTIASAQSGFAPVPGAWRMFEITTRLDIDEPRGRVQAWIPLPSINEPEWFRSNGNTWTGNAATAELARDPNYGAEMLHVAWTDRDIAPWVEVTSRIAARDRATDLSKPQGAPSLSSDQRRFYTEATDLVPVDGIVKETADRITANVASEVEKARAIYEWIVENTYRDAKVHGCGVGDIAVMLKTGALGGKCADLNALFVGLARASGLPARDIYGIRVAPSRFGYKSLGAGSEQITKAQHCRAEVHLAGFGWVAMDPADVRKVVLEEPPGNLTLASAKVAAARKALFGAWEGNWLAYNFAHDLTLPGASGPKLEFLMYPQAETVTGRLDCLDPDSFRYAITSKELTVT